MESTIHYQSVPLSTFSIEHIATRGHLRKIDTLASGPGLGLATPTRKPVYPNTHDEPSKRGTKNLEIFPRSIKRVACLDRIGTCTGFIRFSWLARLNAESSPSAIVSQCVWLLSNLCPLSNSLSGSAKWRRRLKDSQSPAPLAAIMLLAARVPSL